MSAEGETKQNGTASADKTIKTHKIRKNIKNILLDPIILRTGT